jgi:hypothetical protein
MKLGCVNSDVTCEGEPTNVSRSKLSGESPAKYQGIFFLRETLDACNATCDTFSNFFINSSDYIRVVQG